MLWRTIPTMKRLILPVFAMLVLLAAAPANAEITNPHGVAVIIGNKAYEGGLPQVDFAHNDADAFLAFVIDVLGYDPENIIDLRDATKAQLETAFGNERTYKGNLWRFLDPRGMSDVVVFYSGHGVPSLKDGRGYLLPVNADPNIPEINGYPIDLLYENLTKLQARSIAVYLDACFSGNSHRGMLIRSTSGLSISQVLPGQATEMTVITAAQGDQVASWDLEAERGLFTRYLLEALRGAADGAEFGNGDAVVSLGEVQAYLDLHMTRAARREFGRNQDATALGDPNVVLAAVQAAPPPPPDPAGPDVVELDEILDAEMFALANVNVRAGPTTQTEKLITIANGAPVAVTGKTGDWYQVALADGGVGYILGRYLGEDEPGPTPAEVEVAFWDRVKDSTIPAGFDAYLAEYPAGQFAALANTRLAALRAAAEREAQAARDQEAQAARDRKAQAARDREAQAAQVAALENRNRWREAKLALDGPFTITGHRVWYPSSLVTGERYDLDGPGNTATLYYHLTTGSWISFIGKTAAANKINEFWTDYGFQFRSRDIEIQVVLGEAPFNVAFGVNADQQYCGAFFCAAW